MGSRVSTRRLPETASKAVNAKKSSIVNQLPTQSLKNSYEKHSQEEMQRQAFLDPKQEGHLKNDETSKKETSEGGSTQLHSQLSQNNTQSFGSSGRRTDIATSSNNVPEGKDGYDPQVSPEQEKYFIDSITQLGKQVHSTSQTARSRPDSMALKQLQFRKSLFQKGQKELEQQKDPQGPMMSGGANGGGSVERTMIHPRTLGAILKDLEDPRTTKSMILEDYQLAPGFLSGLERFRVASTVYIEPKEDKEGEIAPAVGEPERTLLDYDGAGEVGEKMDQQRVEKLKSRLGMDE
ncbi:hypothetical protein QFC19_000397 [Naganishia cerealis]|uniref:Uncharacterized protein n=1 Tax=Naganishia cerealis TaxID=610337 RepID=A0ACC2WSH3_9TREE|nr:hypothetical protein QFC19_000397 [Naganishia cerealis]